ncbi:hypothetical protein PCANC_02700 [Puccinia coronata f. sp. avenae]|uniref:Uncharacterized protein n=1 Tax=Puccinia coronata f. sp. avenae TaxID=200324 RepID=A0A2N5VY87_9BASI|nr:hypothetical protein PCANC_02700 [Puccinia coronata f. sp. avenae]
MYLKAQGDKKIYTRRFSRHSPRSSPIPNGTLRRGRFAPAQALRIEGLVVNGGSQEPRTGALGASGVHGSPHIGCPSEIPLNSKSPTNSHQHTSPNQQSNPAVLLYGSRRQSM